MNSIAFAVVLATIGFLAARLRVQMLRRSRAEGRLAELALLDGLTGLANRRQFDLVLEREWARARTDGLPLALLMIDVDNFKAYNDRYGHVAGDTALTTIARALAKNVLRKGDLAARYGGPGPTAPLAHLVQIADDALYDAKRGGRNRTAVTPHGAGLRAAAFH